MINEHKQGSMALCWSWTFHLAKICRHFNAALKIATISSVNTFFCTTLLEISVMNEGVPWLFHIVVQIILLLLPWTDWFIKTRIQSLIYLFPCNLLTFKKKNIFCDYIFTITSLALYSCRRFFFTRKTDLYKRIMLIH